MCDNNSRGVLPFSLLLLLYINVDGGIDDGDGAADASFDTACVVLDMLCFVSATNLFFLSFILLITFFVATTAWWLMADGYLLVHCQK